jgi:hypothetical protein
MSLWNGGASFSNGEPLPMPAPTEEEVAAVDWFEVGTDQEIVLAIS